MKNSEKTELDPAKPLPSRLLAVFSLLTGVIYFSSNPKPQNYYDYTFRVAENFLRGAVGFSERRPSWLNEFVPFEGAWYSVFPLGAVLSMIPAAALRTTGLISEMPGAWIAAILAGCVCFLLFKIASKYDLPQSKQILLIAGILFGTFMWTNLTFAGAWQLALGFSMVGELGAIYFTVYERRPLIAGIFFAIAFGNRTENLLTAPVFMYLLCRQEFRGGDAETRITSSNSRTAEFNDAKPNFKFDISNLARFCAVPFVLGVATLGYNYIRFHSFTDFGYARIQGVLAEPWYSHGIFSIYYIPRQAWEMLFKSWEWTGTFPYLFPDGFSNSILLSSPFLLFIFRFGARDRALKMASSTAILALTFIHWIHGNSGGWQFGYRYSMVLLPWIFVILLESAPKRITPVEWAMYGVSFAMNIYATWLFHWSGHLKPY